MARSVIDLSSSPEPSMSLARRKAKPKPKPRSRTSPFPIIELTDSDSDTDDAPTFSPQRKKIQNNPVAGTSSHPSGIAALQPKIGLSGSFENIPNTANRMLKASIARAFPLLELSDEENKPPESPFVAVLPIVERFSPFETVEMEDVQPANPPAAVVETVDHVPEADPISTYVARVLEIVPDVEPDYLLDLVTQSIPTQGDQAVEHVLHSLFEHPTYPKVDRKGKRKQGDGNTEGDEMPSKKTKLDYRNKERLYNGGVHYADMALVLPYILTGVVFPDMSIYLGAIANRLSVYP
jgi:TRIAD3 protein (E3 ubiquitin-protein ligase RNF216)